MFLIMENISEILLLLMISLREFICVQLRDFQIKKNYFKIFNIASGRPIKLTKFIKIIEKN